MLCTFHAHTTAALSAHPGSFLLLLLLSVTPALAQPGSGCWVNNTRPKVYENNPPGYVVTTLFSDPGYSFSISPESHGNKFEIVGTNLTLKESLDYEDASLDTPVLLVNLLCQRSSITVKSIMVILELLNVNDEAPKFSETEIIRNVSEDIKVGSSIGPPIYAVDGDRDIIFYTLNGTMEAMHHLALINVNNPTIVVRQALDYDRTKYLKFLLYARDTELPEENNHTATATILVNILDVDNTPPWFQPCIVLNGNSKICISNGYETWVNVSEQAIGALVLQPGPLYALDGDTGINEPITYEITSGNPDDIFAIDNVSGNITMKKAANTVGTIILQVLATQINDPLKYALTTVQIYVIEKSNFPPQFQSSHYQGMIPAHAENGSLVMENRASGKPLQIFARDDDFPDKLNPAITYAVQNSSAFRISRDGFVLTNAVLSSVTTISFLAKAVDVKSTQEATTLVSVEVTPFIGSVTSTTIATTRQPPGSLTSTLPPGPSSKTTRNPSGTTTKTSETTKYSTGPTFRPIGTTQTKASTGKPGSLVTTTRVPLSPVSSISTKKPSGTTGKPATGIPTGTLVTTTRAPPLPVSSISTTKPSGITQATTTTTKGKPATGIPLSSLVTTARVPLPPVSSMSTAKISGTASASTGLPGSKTTNPLVTGASFTTGKTAGSAGPGRSTTWYTNIPEGPFPSGPQPVQFQYTAAHMAAVGASLAVLLFVCIIAVGFLAYKLYRKNQEKGTDSSNGNIKEKVNYGIDDDDGKSGPTDTEKKIAALNLAFEDVESITEEQGLDVPPLIEEEGSSDPAKPHEDTKEEPDIDSEKNMKSILTKERRTDEGYKAVWFKEDIEPDTKDKGEEEGLGESEEIVEEERDNKEGEEAVREDKQDDSYDGDYHSPIGDTFM